MATWSGAILLPNAARSASSAAVGSAFSRSQRVMTNSAAVPVLASERDGPFRARLDAARRVHREQRGVGGGEALDDLAREVGVAGRVDERDLVAAVVERGDASEERQLALLLLGLEVEHRCPVVDSAQPVDGAGGVEQVLGEGGLAGAGVTGEHDVTEVGHVVGHGVSI